MEERLTVENLFELLDLDAKIQERLLDLVKSRRKRMNSFFIAREDALEECDDYYDKHQIFSGSIVELGLICRTLASEKLELECDIMFPMGEITDASASKFLSEVSGNPGYYYLHGANGEYLNTYFSNVLFNPAHYLLGIRELKAAKLRQELFKNHQDIVDTSIMKDQNIHGYLSSVHGPSMMFDTSVLDILRFSRDSPLLYSYIGLNSGMYAIDEVQCLALKFIPNYAANWIKGTEQGWPYQATCLEIRKVGIHIVPKDLDEKVQSTWRVSFSQAETILFGSLTRFDKLVYLVYKAIAYVHIKCKEFEYIVGGVAHTLQSYLFKTNFFHFMKENSLDYCKNENLANLCRVLQGLLLKTKEALEKKFCSNFFVPSINILEVDTIPNEILVSIIKKLEEMISRVPLFLPRNMKQTSQLVNIFDHILGACIQYNDMKINLKNTHTGKLHKSKQEIIDDCMFKLCLRFPEFKRISNRSSGCCKDVLYFGVAMGHFDNFMRSLSLTGPSILDSAAILRWEKMRNAEVKFCQKIFHFLETGEFYYFTDLEKLAVSNGQKCIDFNDCESTWKTFYERVISDGLL